MTGSLVPGRCLFASVEAVVLIFNQRYARSHYALRIHTANLSISGCVFFLLRWAASFSHGREGAYLLPPFHLSALMSAVLC